MCLLIPNEKIGHGRFRYCMSVPEFFVQKASNSSMLLPQLQAVCFCLNLLGALLLLRICLLSELAVVQIHLFGIWFTPVD